MPIEFSVAAFRLGHSMVRRAYNWNSHFDDGAGAEVPTAALLDRLRAGESATQVREALGLRQRLADESGGEDDRRELAAVGNNLGILLLAEGRYAEAEQQFQRALSRAPANGW